MLVTIELSTVADVFAAPQVDPFDSRYHALSAMDRIATLLGESRVPSQLHVVFVLPASSPRSETLSTDLQPALARYNDVALSLARTDLNARWLAVKRNLAIGLPILAVSLALAAGISDATFVSTRVRDLMANAVTILGTVALWGPIDQLLFGLQPLRRLVLVRRAMLAMTFELRFVDVT